MSGKKNTIIKNLKARLSLFNRARKYQKFMELVQPNSTTTILDVGFSNREDADSYNYLEKNYPYPQNITALGLEEAKAFSQRYPQVTTVKYDGGRFPFEDKFFDVCWSNAVIEHVGDRAKQKIFIEEVKRVSKVAFLTTPNKYFPVEVHTNVFLLHFLLPKKIFDRYLNFTNRKWAMGDWLNLLSLQDIKKLLLSNQINNYQIIKNKLWGFTLDFVIFFSESRL